MDFIKSSFKLLCIISTWSCIYNILLLIKRIDKKKLNDKNYKS